MMGNIYKKLDERFEKMYDEEGNPIEKHPALKSLGIGFCEGLLDYCTIFGAVAVVGIAVIGTLGYTFNIAKK